jgi:hypothetical protein
MSNHMNLNMQSAMMTSSLGADEAQGSQLPELTKNRKIKQVVVTKKQNPAETGTMLDGPREAQGPKNHFAGRSQSLVDKYPGNKKYPHNFKL